MYRKEEESNEKDGHQEKKQHPSRRVDSDKNGNDPLEYYETKSSAADEKNNIMSSSSIEPLPTHNRPARPVSRPGAFRVDGLFASSSTCSSIEDERSHDNHNYDEQSNNRNDDEYSVFVIPSASLVQEGVDLDVDDYYERRMNNHRSSHSQSQKPEATVSPELVHASPLDLGILQQPAPADLRRHQPEKPKENSKQNLVISKRWAILIAVVVCLILSIVTVGVTVFIVTRPGDPEAPDDLRRPPPKAAANIENDQDNNNTGGGRDGGRDGDGGGGGGGRDRKTNLRRRLGFKKDIAFLHDEVKHWSDIDDAKHIPRSYEH